VGGGRISIKEFGAKKIRRKMVQKNKRVKLASHA
jgi:hypothetical protein